MKNTLDYAYQNGLYNFNKDKKQQDLIKIGYFVGNWMEELHLLNFSNLRTLEKMKETNHLETTSEYTELYQVGYKDTHECAYIADTAHTAFDVRLPPTLQAMVNSISMDNVEVKIVKQMPGQSFAFHIDFFHRYREKDSLEDIGIRRILVTLSPWDWGHFVQWGNQILHHWNGGEIFYSDYAVPHATANAGRTPRYSMYVTGKPKEELKDWLKEPALQRICV